MLDGITLFAIKNELSNLFIDSKIIRVFQTSKYKLILEITPKKKRFNLKNHKNNYFLHLSVHPSYPEIYFSETMDGDLVNSPFLASIQTHLKGGRIISIKQPEFDRILLFKIKPFIRFGKIRDKILIVEFMGKHSNIILIREDGIIDNSIKMIPSEINRFREIIPGATYISPPSQNKLNPFNIDKSIFFDILNTHKGKKFNFWQTLQNSFLGLSRQSAKEIVILANISPEKNFTDSTPEDFEHLWISFHKTFLDVRNLHFSPMAFQSPDTGKMISYSVINSVQFPQYEKILFKDVNSCLSHYYKKLVMEKELSFLKNKLSGIFNKNLNKIKLKIDDYREKCDETENCEKYKQYGELIKSNLHLLKRGTKEVTLFNYFSPTAQSISVPLDDKLTPLQNAQKYFKKYRKAKVSYKTILHYLSNHQTAFDKLNQLYIIFLQSNPTYPELSLIKQKLIKLGYAEKSKKIVKKKKREISFPTRYISGDGWIIFVGKNSKQNDLLTMKLASGNDIWLHVKNCFGSHVIIKNRGMGQTPPLETLIEAANLAVYFSKAKNESKIQVDYTLKKYVKKPRNAKPGMVIYSQEKNLFIALNQRLINNIFSRKFD